MSEDSVVAKSFSLAVSVEREENGDPHNSKDARVIRLLETMGPPENGDIGTRASKLKKLLGSIAQQKCSYTSAHSMDNKKEPLSRKTVTQLK